MAEANLLIRWLRFNDTLCMHLSERISTRTGSVGKINAVRGNEMEVIVTVMSELWQTRWAVEARGRGLYGNRGSVQAAEWVDSWADLMD